MNAGTRTARDTLAAGWQSHLMTQDMQMHTWDIELGFWSWCREGRFKLTSEYHQQHESEVWVRMRGLQCRTHSELLSRPASGVRSILLDGWNLLRFLQLHRQIDALYLRLFGSINAELILPGAGDRELAVAKLEALEQIIMQEVIAGDRAQDWAHS